jgi:hypothetical protein
VSIHVSESKINKATDGTDTNPIDFVNFHFKTSKSDINLLQLAKSVQKGFLGGG